MRPLRTLVVATVAMFAFSQGASAVLLHYLAYEEGAGGTTVNFGTAGGVGTINNDATGGLGAGGNAWVLGDAERGTVLSGNDNGGTSAFTTTSGVAHTTMNGSWTQTVWAAVTGTGNDVVLGHRRGGPGGFSKLDTNNFEWNPNGAGSGGNTGPGTGTGALTDWHQFTVVKDGSTITTYRDGVQTGTNGGRTKVYNAGTVPWNVFGDDNERPGGLVDDAAFFLEAQTAGEVAAMYNLSDRTQAAGYDLVDIDGIFNVFNNGGTFVTLDGLTWSQAAGLAGGIGVLEQDGLGFAIQLNGQGQGVAAAGPIPEPTTGLLAALGLMSMAGVRRRRQQ